jgi:hypothetical protein
MKLHADTKQVSRGGTQAETQFTIKATSKAFSILSSSLYSDKILAPVRELCCNAFDAHVAAGKTDVPIEVKLPNSLDPTFHVKDFGIGLDHEGVMKLYTTYFDSTKTESDEYIGALGLGSKSPFAYTGNFNVESRFNGFKRLYAAFISESGVPALTEMCDPTATDEPNGLTVSFSVRRGDESKFINAAKKALMYFSPRPTVIGCSSFEAYRLKHTLTGDKWAMRDSDYYANMSGAFVVQGFVSYPIDASMLAEHGLSDTAYNIAKTNLDLFVSIGEVEVAPSREALSYDKRTIKTLIERLEAVAKVMHDTIQQQFDDCTDMWLARLKFSKYKEDNSNALGSVFTLLHEQKPFEYKGEKLSRRINLDLSAIKATTILVYYHKRNGRKVDRTGQWNPSSSGSSFAFEVQDNFTVLVDDVVKGSASMIEAYLNDVMTQNSRPNARVLVIRPIAKSEYSDTEIDSILEQFGGLLKVKISSLNYATVKRATSYKPRAKGHCLRFTGFPDNAGYRKNETRRVFSRLTWRTEEVDFNLGGFYMPLERFSVSHKGIVMDYLDEILTRSLALGFMTEDEQDRTYGFSDRDLAATKGDKNWVNLFDYLEGKITALIKSGIPGNLLAAKGAWDSYRGMCSFVGQSTWADVNDSLKGGEFKDFLTDLHDVRSVNSNCDIDTLSALCSNLRTDRPTSAGVEKKLRTKWNNVLLTYPMLTLISWNNTLDGSQRDMILDYVSTIDAVKVPAKILKVA